MIAMIAAMAANRVIGVGGRIPWDLPEDREYFRERTMGHVLVMGRRTWEEIGKPLPGRRTCVVTSLRGRLGEAAWTAPSVGEAVRMAQERCPERHIFLCGGEAVYREGMALAECIYLTELDDEVEGDAFFPEIGKDFQLVRKKRGKGFSFCIYRKT